MILIMMVSRKMFLYAQALYFPRHTPASYIVMQQCIAIFSTNYIRSAIFLPMHLPILQL